AIGLGHDLGHAPRPGDAAGAARRLVRVRKPCREGVATRVEEDLARVLTAAKPSRVNDPVAIARKRRSQSAIVPRARAPAGLVRPDRQRREPGLLLLADPRCEGVSDSPCEFGHGTDSSRSPGRGGSAFSEPPGRQPHLPRGTPVHPDWGRKRAPEFTLTR